MSGELLTLVAGLCSEHGRYDVGDVGGSLRSQRCPHCVEDEKILEEAIALVARAVDDMVTADNSWHRTQARASLREALLAFVREARR